MLARANLSDDDKTMLVTKFSLAWPLEGMTANSTLTMHFDVVGANDNLHCTNDAHGRPIARFQNNEIETRLPMRVLCV